MTSPQYEQSSTRMVYQESATRLGLGALESAQGATKAFSETNGTEVEFFRNRKNFDSDIFNSHSRPAIKWQSALFFGNKNIVPMTGTFVVGCHHNE